MVDTKFAPGAACDDMIARSCSQFRVDANENTFASKALTEVLKRWEGSNIKGNSFLKGVVHFLLRNKVLGVHDMGRVVAHLKCFVNLSRWNRINILYPRLLDDSY